MTRRNGAKASSIQVKQTDDGLHLANSILWFDAQSSGDLSFLSSAMATLQPKVPQVIATEETINLIRDVQRPGGYNPNLLIWGILPNQYENTLHHREALTDLRAQYPTLVYPDPSRKTTRYNEALDLRLDIRELDPTLGDYWDTIAASVIEKGGRV